MDNTQCWFFYCSFEVLPVTEARSKLAEARVALEATEDIDFVHTSPGDGKKQIPYTTFYGYFPTSRAKSIRDELMRKFEADIGLDVCMFEHIEKKYSDWTPPPSVRRAAIEEEAEAMGAGADLNRKQRRMLDALLKKAMRKNRKGGAPDGHH